MAGKILLHGDIEHKDIVFGTEPEGFQEEYDELLGKTAKRLGGKYNPEKPQLQIKVEFDPHYSDWAISILLNAYLVMGWEIEQKIERSKQIYFFSRSSHP